MNCRKPAGRYEVFRVQRLMNLLTKKPAITSFIGKRCFKVWIDEQLDGKVEPVSGLGKALKYLKKHWKPLTLFLRDGKALPPIASPGISRSKQSPIKLTTKPTPSLRLIRLNSKLA